MKILAIISILGVLGACASTGSVTAHKNICDKPAGKHLPKCEGGNSLR